MFSFHPMTTSSAGHLNDPPGAVPHCKVMPPPLGAVPPPAASGSNGEPSPSSSASPSFPHHGHPNQQMMQRAGGTSPVGGGGALSAGTFPHLQPFFTALARNLANLSPQTQQQQMPQRCHPSTSTPTNSNTVLSAPFCGGGLPNFGHPPNTLMARQQNAKQQHKMQQQNSPSPIGAGGEAAAVQQQLMANWLNMLMTMNGVGGINQQQQMNSTQSANNGGGGGGNNNNNCANAINNGGAQQQRQCQGTKTLESDSDGNSVCPACKEPIGKEPTQWESHLEAEKSRLRGEIESLRAAVLEVHNIGTSQETAPQHHHYNDHQLTEAEFALERIRDSQRRRVNAKVHGHFFLTSPIMSTLIGNKQNNENIAAGIEAAKNDNFKQIEDDDAVDAKNGGGFALRQCANNGFAASSLFSALELARGPKQKDEEEEEQMKRTSPEAMSPEETKRMSSPARIKGLSPETMKRMSPAEWVKRISSEEIKRPRMEL